MWTSWERAELVRVKNAFGRALYGQSWSEGVTERGEPWLVALDLEDDTLILHIARLDGRYIALDAALDEIAVGYDLPSFVDACIAGLGQGRPPEASNIVRLRLAHGRLAAFAALIMDMMREELAAAQNLQADQKEAGEGSGRGPGRSETPARRSQDQTTEGAELAPADRGMRNTRQMAPSAISDLRGPGSDAAPPAFAALPILLIAGAVELGRAGSEHAQAAATVADGTPDESGQGGHPAAPDPIDLPAGKPPDLGWAPEADIFLFTPEAPDEPVSAVHALEAGTREPDGQAPSFDTGMSRAARPDAAVTSATPTDAASGPDEPAHPDMVPPFARVTKVVAMLRDGRREIAREALEDTIRFGETEMAEQIRETVRGHMEPIVPEIQEAVGAVRAARMETGLGTEQGVEWPLGIDAWGDGAHATPADESLWSREHMIAPAVWERPRLADLLIEEDW